MSSASALLQDEFSDGGWEINGPPANDGLLSEPRISNLVNVPMWIFSSEDEIVACDRAVQVEIKSEGDSCFASCERLHVYSQGRTHRECLDEFQRQVVYFFSDYSSLEEDDVVGLAKELRRLYVDHFSQQVG